jgi:hypothetical protein
LRYLNKPFIKCFSSVVNLTLPHVNFEARHSREGGNPAQKHWIPDQVRNDKICGAIFEALH